MKTNKLFNLMIVACLAIFATSCVQDDEYTVPSAVGAGVEPTVDVNSSIEAVKTAYDQNYNTTGEATFTFDDDSTVAFEGYVVSSDYAGNFYKSIMVQDSPSNPGHGVEILIDKTSLFESFEFGRKVYVKMAGLTVKYEDGDDNDPTNEDPGRYIIGYGSDADEIPQFNYTNYVLRSTEVATITPNVVTIDGFTQDNINTWVQLQDVQFDNNELGKTYAGEASDSFDGFRNIISCATESTVELQTSTFADFKSYVISENKGSMNAVLTKDYRADKYVLIVNNPTNIEFTDTDRCGYAFLDCTGGAMGTGETIFSEDFDSGFSFAGWTNVNVNDGSRDWDLRSFSGNSYLQCGAFRSGEDPMEVWAVTPAINLDSTTDEVLSFVSKVGFYRGDALSTYISTDFSGDPTTATWILINEANYPTSPTSGYGSSFTASGNIDISCFDGDVYIGFRYKGADGGITTTFQVDDIMVTGN